MSTDPLTIAREVLDGSDESDDRFLDFYEARNIAQTLARAVARVEELADRLDDGHLRYLIRAALNGETRD